MRNKVVKPFSVVVVVFFAFVFIVSLSASGKILVNALVSVALITENIPPCVLQGQANFTIIKLICQ